MNGQLWQECPVCGREPVCVDCEHCEKHCTCAQDAEDREQIKRFNEAYPGFLDKIVRYHEEGARER